MVSSPLSIVILAAGKGTRMKSQRAKVLHEVFFAPMIHHVMHSVLPLNPIRTIAVIGHQRSDVENALASFEVEFAVQELQLGTGHAVMVAEEHIAEDSDSVMILCGDIPLIRTSTLQHMYSAHRHLGSTLTIMTTKLEDPTNYGRVLCNEAGDVIEIVEQKDASIDQLEIKEINAGIYCVEKAFLFSALRKVGTDNSQNEVYLTDIVRIAVAEGRRVNKFISHQAIDVLGVNSRVELAEAHQHLQCRRNRELMLQGVTMHNPETIIVSPDSSVGRDTLLEPGTHISRGSCVEGSCTIGQGTVIKNCIIGEGVEIGPYSYLEDSAIPPDAILAPYSRNF